LGGVSYTFFTAKQERKGNPRHEHTVPPREEAASNYARFCRKGCPAARSLRQRCLVHKVRNVLDKVPEGVKQEMKQALWSAYDAPNREVAELLAAKFIAHYGDPYPSAVLVSRRTWPLA
jgi:hypothetical protein